MVVYETQNLITDWKMTQKEKTLTLSCGLRRKNANFRGVEFSILPYTQNRKRGNLGKFSFTWIFGSISKTKSKNWLKMTQNKKQLTLSCGLRRNNAHFRGFRVFDFAL